MFKKLRVQIILIVMSVFGVVILATLGVLNLNISMQVTGNAHLVLDILAEHDGVLPNDLEAVQRNREKDFNWFEFMMYSGRLTNEARYTTRYFKVGIGEDKTFYVNLENIASITEEEAVELTKKALAKHASEATIKDYRYRVVKENGVAKVVYFVDCSQQLALLSGVRKSTINIGVALMLLVFLVVFILSGKVVRPMEENIRLQRQFITDASHELKTPLAAISANADVLEMVMGENEMIEKIKRQTVKMSELVNEMLTLTRMDNKPLEKNTLETVDFSALVSLTLEDFTERITNENKTLVREIAPNISVKGVKKDLARLISVLMDNAVKYCLDNGEIRVKLSANGRVARCEISNSSDPISTKDLKHLFDRFYRTDQSRNRESGSYGIGLSIAKAICNRHGGRIEARNGSKIVIFVAEIPVK